MKDINAPIRKAFYQLLTGSVTVDGFNVAIGDEKVSVKANNYVILSSQTSRDDGTKQSFDREATIILDIVTNQEQSVTKNTADDIADQILVLIFPTPHTHSLTPPTSWQFLNVKLTGDQSLALQNTPTSVTVRRILTFSLRVVQN